MKIKIASLLLFFSVFLAGCITVSNFDRGHFIPSKNEPVEIEFETISDLIIIKAKINGVSGNFLFDNGYSLSGVNKEFAQKANISFNNVSNLTDANNKKEKTQESTADSIVINNQVFFKTGVYQVNTDAFLQCNHIDGIIGASVINKANWKIDFDKKKIKISSTPFKEKGSKLAMSISNNNSSFTKLSIRGISYNFKIDLGSTGSIKINQGFIKNSFEGLLSEKRIGITSISAHGLGNIDTVYYLSEGLTLKHLDTSLPIKEKVTIKDKLKYQGYIGINYLNNYNFIINSTEKEYILQNPKEPIPTNNSSYGMNIYPIGDT